MLQDILLELGQLEQDVLPEQGHMLQDFLVEFFSLEQSCLPKDVPLKGAHAGDFIVRFLNFFGIIQ
jgi:hypothetical protein